MLATVFFSCLALQIWLGLILTRDRDKYCNLTNTIKNDFLEFEDIFTQSWDNCLFLFLYHFVLGSVGVGILDDSSLMSCIWFWLQPDALKGSCNIWEIKIILFSCLILKEMQTLLVLSWLTLLLKSIGFVILLISNAN